MCLQCQNNSDSVGVCVLRAMQYLHQVQISLYRYLVVHTSNYVDSCLRNRCLLLPVLFLIRSLPLSSRFCPLPSSWASSAHICSRLRSLLAMPINARYVVRVWQYSHFVSEQIADYVIPLNQIMLSSIECDVSVRRRRGWWVLKRQAIEKATEKNSYSSNNNCKVNRIKVS